MKRKIKNKKGLKTNSKILIATSILALFIIYYIIRLFQLQILDAYEYKSKGNAVSRIGQTIVPDRGNIFDRNNKPLAISQETENLYLLPVTTEEKSQEAESLRMDDKRFSELDENEKERITKLSSLPTYKNEDIEKLSKILDIEETKFYELIDKEQEGFIYKGITRTQKKQIEALNIKYIRFISSKERFYPNKDILASTIGFVDEEGVANNGLESFYNEILSGENGYREFFKALQGTEIPYTDSKTISPKESQNLITTIDIDVQNILSNALKEAFFQFNSMYSGGIITNPNTGEILAMESLPNFDANDPRSLNSEMDKVYLDKLEEKDRTEYLLSRWRNNNIEKTFDPGSVYKTITTAIGLESNNSLKNKVYQDNGFYELAPGVIIKSWRYWDPHGPQNLREAFKNSSNPVYVQYAQDIGKDKYIEYASVFNLGNKTGIDLPGEITGFFPKNSDISDVDFGTMSYGHYINSTPIQMISALNSTVNGGLYYKPHLIKSITNKNNEEVFTYENKYQSKTISDSTSAEIRDLLKYAGDSYRLNENENYKVGAKTGSTVKYTLDSIFNENKEDKEGLLLSIFAVYPADTPRYTIYLYFDEPLGASFSSEVTVKIAENIVKQLNLLENDGHSEIENVSETIRVPDLIGKTIEEASEIVDELGLKLRTNSDIGRYHIIEEQYPPKDNLIYKNSIIEITTGDNIKMPNIINMNINEVKELFELNKIKYKIEGTGNIVKKQSVTEGDVFTKDQEIVITLEEKE